MPAPDRLLSDASTGALAARIRAVEARTGAKVLVAQVRRTDPFHGLRWRAFALGVVLMALATVVADWVHPQWITSGTTLMNAMLVLGAGLVFALLATYVPAFEHLFLQRPRAEAEVRQRAKALFLEREYFNTPRRDAILLLAGEFEGAVAIVADRLYAGRVSDADWHTVVDAMTPVFRGGAHERAFLAGLEALEKLLVARGFAAHDAAVDASALTGPGTPPGVA
jgi:uncharacterized membrane protein